MEKEAASKKSAKSPTESKKEKDATPLGKKLAEKIKGVVKGQEKETEEELEEEYVLEAKGCAIPWDDIQVLLTSYVVRTHCCVCVCEFIFSESLSHVCFYLSLSLSLSLSLCLCRHTSAVVYCTHSRLLMDSYGGGSGYPVPRPRKHGRSL